MENALSAGVEVAQTAKYFLASLARWGSQVMFLTPGPWQIGDFARAKDTLSVIIVEIDTRIYKTYPKLDLTIVPQLSKRYFEFNQ